MQAAPSMAADAMKLPSQLHNQRDLTCQCRSDLASANSKMWSQVTPCSQSKSQIRTGVINFAPNDRLCYFSGVMRSTTQHINPGVGQAGVWNAVKHD